MGQKTTITIDKDVKKRLDALRPADMTWTEFLDFLAENYASGVPTDEGVVNMLEEIRDSVQSESEQNTQQENVGGELSHQIELLRDEVQNTLPEKTADEVEERLRSGY